MDYFVQKNIFTKKNIIFLNTFFIVHKYINCIFILCKFYKNYHSLSPGRYFDGGPFLGASAPPPWLILGGDV